jgi:hypothetical protein
MDKNDKSDYPVGYKKPPRDTQFKPGQSENRKGRPKRSATFADVLSKQLRKQVTPVDEFRFATDERYKDKNGQWQDRTEWHNLIAWNCTAESVGEYFKQGQQGLHRGQRPAPALPEGSRLRTPRDAATNNIRNVLTFLNRGLSYSRHQHRRSGF